MGERLLCKQEVDGSIPFTSTSARRALVSCRLSAVSSQLEPRDRAKQMSLPVSAELTGACSLTE